MSTISIFCKSYFGDLERAALLVRSVGCFNRDGLSFYMSVPADDLPLFKDRFKDERVILLRDEDIIAANPDIVADVYRSLPGHLSQQIVKSEFWRINPAENYLCVDSDSRFIREFTANDFLAPDGTPYTVLHEDKDYQAFCTAFEIEDAGQNFKQTAIAMQRRFGRSGPLYNFGPFPVVWSRKVWQAFDSALKNRGESIIDAILAMPHEASWYGETLLAHQTIPLIPIEPLFKAYLYYEQFEHDQKHNISENLLSRYYLGVVYQSNWHPKRTLLHKKISYKIKRHLKRWRAHE